VSRERPDTWNVLNACRRDPLGKLIFEAVDPARHGPAVHQFRELLTRRWVVAGFFQLLFEQVGDCVAFLTQFGD